MRVSILIEGQEDVTWEDWLALAPNLILQLATFYWSSFHRCVGPPVGLCECVERKEEAQPARKDCSTSHENLRVDPRVVIGVGPSS